MLGDIEQGGDGVGGSRSAGREGEGEELAAEAGVAGDAAGRVYAGGCDVGDGVDLGDGDGESGRNVDTGGGAGADIHQLRGKGEGRCELGSVGRAGAHGRDGRHVRRQGVDPGYRGEFVDVDEGRGPVVAAGAQGRHEGNLRIAAADSKAGITAGGDDVDLSR